MRRNSILDDDEIHDPISTLLKPNFGTLALLISLTIGLILLFTGFRGQLRLIPFIEVFITIVIGFATILFYHLSREYIGKWSWLVLILGIGVNLFIGLFSYTVMV